jgi:hypothetical protein
LSTSPTLPHTRRAAAKRSGAASLTALCMATDWVSDYYVSISTKSTQPCAKSIRGHSLWGTLRHFVVAVGD